jgi:5'-deoxynucleotidase YfbR-like HD superfamily hydrolase
MSSNHVIIGVCVLTFVTGAATAQSGKSPAPARTIDAATHKQLMSDAGDLQEDLREALAAKANAKVVSAAAKLEKIFVQTEQYWAAKHADDVVALARASQTLTKEVATAARAGKTAQAQDAFTRLGVTCNQCHDLHPEKR